MKHTITITHEIEAETWDTAIAQLLRSDSAAHAAVRCTITNEQEDLLEVNARTLAAAAEKVRDEMDCSLPGALTLSHGRTDLGVIELAGWRLVSTKHLRLLLQRRDSELMPLLHQAREAVQKSAARGGAKALAAQRAIDAFIGEMQ